MILVKAGVRSEREKEQSKILFFKKKGVVQPPIPHNSSPAGGFLHLLGEEAVGAVDPASRTAGQPAGPNVSRRACCIG